MAKNHQNKFALALCFVFAALLAVSGALALGNYTRDEAVSAILQSETLMSQLQENNFSVSYVNDTLIAAQNALQQADYAEVLRGAGNVTSKAKAFEALKLIKWQDLSYDNVILETDKIKASYDKAFSTFDAINALEAEAVKAENEGLNVDGAKSILEKARQAFNDERYSDAESLLADARNALESSKAGSAVIFGTRIGIKNTIQRFWPYILLALAALFMGAYYLAFYLKRNYLVRKIARLRTEREVLMNLMVKTQTERFKENKISGLVYNIRMAKYKEKLEKIKETLPVFEEQLKVKRFLFS